MVQSYKTCVDGYAEKGLINKEALMVTNHDISHRPMHPFEEFTLDAYVYANASVGMLIRLCHGKPDWSLKAWTRTVHDSVQAAVGLWESCGYTWSDRDVAACERYVSCYLGGCFTARLRGMFRSNTIERQHLYAAMARAGMSRTDARESLDKVLSQLYPTHPDNGYTDEVLDAFVQECIDTGVIRVH